MRILAACALAGLAAVLLIERGSTGHRTRPDVMTPEPERPARPDGHVHGLRGRVVKDGRPLAGARVCLWPGIDPYEGRQERGELTPRETEPLGEERSGADGRFVLHPPDGGYWLVYVEAEGCMPWMEYCRPTAEIEAELEVELETAEESVFTVVERDGTPIVGARIALSRYDPLAAPLSTTEPPIPVYVTGRDGKVEVPLCERPALDVHARGFTPRTIVRVGLLEDGRIVLDPAQRIAGVVTDEAGHPVAGALVGLDYGRTRTARDGSFQFEEARSCTMVVTAAGFALDAREVFAGDTAVRVRLRRLVTVSGQVVLADGTPVAGAQVADAGDWRSAVPTDAGGRFRLVCGSDELQVRHGRPDLPVRVGEGATALHGVFSIEERSNLRLVLEPMVYSFLRLRVLLPSGEPATRLWYDTIPNNVNESDLYLGSDGDYLLVFDKTAGTPVRVAVTVRGEQPGTHVEAMTAATPHGPPRTVRLPAARRIRFDVGAIPAGDVRIRFFPREAWQGDNGLEWFVNPELLYTVSISASGYRRAALTGFRADGDVVHVALDRGTTVSGRVIDAAGEPVPRVKARVHGHGSDRTGADGRFSIERTPAGPARLSIWRENADERQTGIEIGRLEITAGPVGDLRVQAPLRVHGRVRDRRGRPIGGALVRLMPLTGPRTTTRSDGTFALDVSPMDDYFLVVSRDGYGARAVGVRDIPRPVTLGPAAAARVHVPVPAGWGRRTFWIHVEHAGFRWQRGLGWPLLQGKPVVHEVVLENLPAGPVTFHVEGMTFDPITATLEPGKTAVIRFRR